MNIMKQFYFLILLTFGFAFLGTAQNSVTVNASATQNGYAMYFSQMVILLLVTMGRSGLKDGSRCRG